MRSLTATGLIGALLLVATAGCGGSNKSSAPETGSSTIMPPATTSTTETGGIDTLPGAGTTPVEQKSGTSETALLERVAIGRHEGYDRVVFQFRNGLPGYRVEYVEPPLREDGSGNVVDVKGSAFVVVRMEPASGFDLSKSEGELVYKGPRRLEGSDAGTSIVREVVRTGDFEAVLHWAIGLEEQVDFRVVTAESPPRLIVDFRNH